MPIASMQSMLEKGILNAFSLDQASNKATTAQMLTDALASIIPAGLFPVAPSPPFPKNLSPSGYGACKNLMELALSMEQASQNTTTAQIMAQAVSVIAPIVPPSGLVALQNQLLNSLSMEQASQNTTTAKLMAAAIITYYVSAGVL